MHLSEAHNWLRQRNLQRIVGVLLLAYVVIVALQVVARTMSYDSQLPFYEGLLLTIANLHLYLTSMYAGAIANVLLVVVAAGLYSIFVVYQADLARVSAFLLLTAAAASLLSSGSGLAVASLIQDYSGSDLQPGSILISAQAVDSMREAFGRIGFTLSALGVLAFGGFIAGSGTLPRWVGYAGIAAAMVMFFIWVDSAPPAIHRLGGLAYLLWLALLGGWLIMKGTRPGLEESLSGT